MLVTDPAECAKRFATLTDRQREVLLCVIRENGRKPAARCLRIELATVEETLRVARQKLGAPSVTAAAVMAVKAGVL